MADVKPTSASPRSLVPSLSHTFRVVVAVEWPMMTSSILWGDIKAHSIFIALHKWFHYCTGLTDTKTD